MRPNASPDGDEPKAFSLSAVSQFVSRQMQIHLISAISKSAEKLSSSDPSANLANYADQIESFVRKVDWSDRPKDTWEGIKSLGNEARLNAAAGTVMLAAGVTAHDGVRVRKAVDYFERASSVRDSSEESKSAIWNDWKHNYKDTLFMDALINKTERSARLVSSMYLEDYEEAVKNRGVLSYHLFRKAGIAASAFSTLYQITHNQVDADSTTLFACESLLWLHYWREDRVREERRDAELAKKGLSPGLLPDAPSPEGTEAYKLLLGSGKDPTVIFARKSRIKETADCKSF